VHSTRPVLGGYSVALVDQLVAIVAASTISAYSLYTFTASDSSLMMVTIPFVVFGLFRYLQLVHARAAGGEEAGAHARHRRPAARHDRRVGRRGSGDSHRRLSYSARFRSTTTS
jgi:hypothetical protein